MVLRILFREITKKYPQNTYRMHKCLSQKLYTLFIRSILCSERYFHTPVAAKAHPFRLWQSSVSRMIQPSSPSDRLCLWTFALS